MVDMFSDIVVRGYIILVYRAQVRVFKQSPPPLEALLFARPSGRSNPGGVGRGGGEERC